MAIISKRDAENVKGKLLFEAGKDYEIEYCGLECLLKGKEPALEIVSNGQTEKTALAAKDDEFLYLPINVQKRDFTHPLGQQKGLLTRKEIFENIKKIQHSNLMSINSVCMCTAKVEIVHGLPLLDVDTMPSWQKKINNFNDGILKSGKKIEFSKWQRWMIDLSSALLALHNQKIFHGDAYPFNIVVTEEKATWIDYSHVTDDSSYRIKDVYAFTFYTCLYSSLYCDFMSFGLIKDLLTVIQKQDEEECLKEILHVLEEKRDDLIPQNTDLLTKEIYENFSSIPSKNKTTEEFFYKGLLHYYSSFISWMKASSYYKNKLDITILRAEAKEKEMKRLMVPKGMLEQLESDRHQALIKLEALEKEYKEKIELAVEKQRDLSCENALHIEQLNEKRADAEKEQSLLRAKVSRLEAQLSELSNDYTTKQQSVIEEVADIVNDLMVAQSLKSQKIGKVARVMKQEYKINKVKGFAKVSSKMLKFLRGKKGYFSEYNESDPIYIATQKLQNIHSRINESQGYNGINLESNLTAEIRKSYVNHSNSSKRVAYFTNQLLDWFDQRPRYGGGERYCVSLADLMRSKGLQVDIYQIAPAEFEGDYYGYKVKALKHGEFFSEFNIDAANQFYDISLGYDHVIYNMPELSAGKMRADAISITHGIWFDHNNYGPSFKFREPEWFRYLHKAYANPSKIVSVDTNSINVMRSFWPEVSNKMKYIPNFVDHSKFTPPVEERKNNKLKILFPRRSQINRGSRILEQILLNVPHDVEFYWVGEGDPYDTELIKNLTKKDKRLSYEKDADFDEMQSWYQQSDIVVIPTIACEGTSLSCIEALASGCATIATNVGGLTDIIQDGFNGRCVEPDPLEIAKAINQLIENDELRAEYQTKGYESSFMFSLDNWKKRWEEVLIREGWIEEDKDSLEKNVNLKSREARVAIVTRNAYHGGVESLIKLEQEHLNASVFVAGGLNDPEGTCPFIYQYTETYEKLLKELQNYDVILYHWLYDWAVQAIKDSGIPSIEFVHRTDTAENDKTVPTLLATHSDYIATYLEDNYNKAAVVIPNAVDMEKFHPKSQGNFNNITLITSYYKTKGIDVFLKGWKLIHSNYPDYTVRIYGKGEERESIEQLAIDLGINVEFHGPTSNPEKILNETSVVVTASRIEGLPIAVIEALSCNVPVIASDIDGHRIFNELAERIELPEPLLLFESENELALAQTLDRFLKGEIQQDFSSGRSVVQNFFSPENHTGLLKEKIDEIKDKKTSPTFFAKLGEFVNNGVSLQEGGKEGFYKKIINVNEEIQVDNDPVLLSTHDQFLCYRFELLPGTKKLSLEVGTKAANSVNVFVQVDWLDNNLQQISIQGRGQYIDSKALNLYELFLIPEETLLNVYAADIIMRPNPGESFEVEYVKIISYA